MAIDPLNFETEEEKRKRLLTEALGIAPRKYTMEPSAETVMEDLLSRNPYQSRKPPAPSTPSQDEIASEVLARAGKATPSPVDMPSDDPETPTREDVSSTTGEDIAQILSWIGDGLDVKRRVEGGAPDKRFANIRQQIDQGVQARQARADRNHQQDVANLFRERDVVMQEQKAAREAAMDDPNSPTSLQARAYVQRLGELSGYPVPEEDLAQITERNAPMYAQIGRAAFGQKLNRQSADEAATRKQQGDQANAEGQLQMLRDANVPIPEGVTASNPEGVDKLYNWALSQEQFKNRLEVAKLRKRGKGSGGTSHAQTTAFDGEIGKLDNPASVSREVRNKRLDEINAAKQEMIRAGDKASEILYKELVSEEKGLRMANRLPPGITADVELDDDDIGEIKKANRLMSKLRANTEKLYELLPEGIGEATVREIADKLEVVGLDSVAADKRGRAVSLLIKNYVTLKEFYELGVLNGPDMDILSKSEGDPESWMAQASGRAKRNLWAGYNDFRDGIMAAAESQGINLGDDWMLSPGAKKQLDAENQTPETVPVPGGSPAPNTSNRRQELDAEEAEIMRQLGRTQ